VVGTDYPEPDVMSRQYTSTLGDYADLDRFDRVVTSKWTKDLTTDVDFYRVAYTWDRNSNVTSADDQVHTGFDVKYAMDGIDRLVDADEGTLASGSISSRTRRQQWALNQTGNWDNDKVDLNGDGDWADTDEVNDTRTHNAVNELSARNTDSAGGNEYTLAYDGVGNLTDDGEDYEYGWDPFGRLRTIKRTDNQALVAEYRYNGLGYRIAVHEDTDTDADVDSNDKWYFDAFDERWRQVARFRESDTSPKEEFVPHVAGIQRVGRSRYIDLVISRYKDANTAWTAAADGVCEEVVYYCQNQRADVSAIVSSDGQLKEWIRYAAYGVPFGLPGGDANSDGDCGPADVAQINAWFGNSVYDVRGDVDLDGDVDAADGASAQSAPLYGATGGRLIGSPILDSRRLFGGLESLGIGSISDSRRRPFASSLGVWVARDPKVYIDGPSLYGALKSNPVRNIDPLGTAVIPCPGSGALPGLFHASCTGTGLDLNLALAACDSNFWEGVWDSLAGDTCAPCTGTCTKHFSGPSPGWLYRTTGNGCTDAQVGPVVVVTCSGSTTMISQHCQCNHRIPEPPLPPPPSTPAPSGGGPGTGGPTGTPAGPGTPVGPSTGTY